MAVDRSLPKAEFDELTHRAKQSKKLTHAAAGLTELTPQAFPESTLLTRLRARGKAVEEIFDSEEGPSGGAIELSTSIREEHVTSANLIEGYSVNRDFSGLLEIAQAGSVPSANLGPAEPTALGAAGAGGASSGGAFAGGSLGMVGAAAGGLAAIAVGTGGGGKSSALALAPPPPTIGKLVDGYISGATVFQDNDRDGVLDSDEPSAVTDGSGAFTLAIKPNGGPIVAQGGTDLGTGKPSTNVFKATPSSTVVSPLTTLINELVLSGKTETQAATSVAQALGLEGLDLKNFDPIQTATDPNSTAQQAAIKVSAAAVMVANLMDMGASVLKGAGSKGANDSGTIAASLAEIVLKAPAGQVLDLGSPETIKVMLNSAAATSLSGNAAAISVVANSANVAATVMAASNAQAAAAAQSADPIEALSLLAKTQTVALESASAALESAVTAVRNGGTASLTALISSYTGKALSNAVNAAQVGQITSAIKVVNVETVPLEVKIPVGSAIKVERIVPEAAINVGGNGADGILSAGQSASISIRFNGPVTSFNASDIKLSAGLTLSALTQVSASLYTATVTATSAAQGAQAITLGTDWKISGSAPVAPVVQRLFVGAFTQLTLEDAGTSAVGFEGAVATIETQANGNHIVKVVKPVGARPYAGVTVGENSSLTVKQLPFDATHKTLSMWVHSPKAGATVQIELGSSSVGQVRQYLLADRPLLEARTVPRLEPADAVLHHALGGARASRDHDRLVAAEPGRVDLVGAVDEMSADAPLACQFGQPLTVGAVLAAQHDHDVGARGEEADGLLAVLGGVADVVLGRPDDLREAFLEPADDPRGVVDGERRLREVGEFVAGAEGKRVDFLGGFHEREGIGRLAHRADHLVVPLVADEHDVVALLRVLDRLQVDLRHQWAGGVDRPQPAVRRHAAHLGGDSVRGEEQHRPLRHLLHGVHEHRPLLHEPVDHVAVVDDLVEDVDRGAVDANRGLQRLDRHVDAGAEAARAGEQDLHAGIPGGVRWSAAAGSIG